eukprot:TRINITY_DN6428_c0_g1_i2.p1 TRINITY_DN6428_c0_g1~~TRINITY_DN6428_c0_g1_i2.p1  ORF type:complete len:118 (+),score=3.20 TRINITY_DN6428_c0_g1_i2:148-501(+)
MKPKTNISIGGSDSNPSHGITSMKLNGQNFLPWSRAVTLYLGSRGKLGLIRGSNAQPLSSDATFPQWEIDNYTVLSWLFASMEESIYTMFMFHETASQLWDALTQMYAHTKNAPRVY